MRNKSSLVLLFIVLILLPSCGSLKASPFAILELQTYRVCSGERAVQEQRAFGQYEVRISSSSDQQCHHLEISQNGNRVFTDEQIGGHFFFGMEDEDIPPLMNLSGHSEIYLVMTKWSGGAHCCYSLFPFKLGKEFFALPAIEGGNSIPVFKDLDSDGVPEIELLDDVLAYRFSSFGSSPMGKLILRYAESGYALAPDLMKDPGLLMPSPQEVSLWRQKILNPKEGEDVPTELIQAMTDLIYAGSENDALDLLDKTWPDGVNGKADFVASYLEALGESTYFRTY